MYAYIRIDVDVRILHTYPFDCSSYAGMLVKTGSPTLYNACRVLVCETNVLCLVFVTVCLRGIFARPHAWGVFGFGAQMKGA